MSASTSANHLVLGQRKVDDKSNEITAIPELLGVLNVSGCIASIDVMGCKHDKPVCAGIHAKRLRAGWGEDYLLSILAGVS